MGGFPFDASYVVLAKENGLSLVTEDEELREKARGLVKVVDLGGLGLGFTEES